VRFDVSAEGAPFNVQATYCTQSLFERATVKSVQRWKFNPKIVNNRPVAMRGVENKVSYRLTDERGNIIPE
jgi:protein TonB